MRTLTREVIFSTLCDSLIGGVILTAFALHLGASYALIGTLAAVRLWTQLLQGPAVLLVTRLRARKLIAVAGSLASSVAPVILAFLAFSKDSPAAQNGVVAAIALYAGAGAFTACAWTAWARDLVPGDVRGRFFGRRSTFSIAASLAAGLAAAAALDLAPEGFRWRATVFAGLFAFAFVSQVASATVLSRAPEPSMPPSPPKVERLVSLLRKPVADVKFRRLIAFVASWQFAVNLAQPFVSVFLLRQLGFGMTFVMALSLVAQLARLLTISRWGAIADRFNDKSVLNLAAPLYIGCIAGVIGASQFSSREVAAAYLIVLAVLAGCASAGVTLASGNIVMHMSPRGEAEAYIAANALIGAAAGGIAPILGGLAADEFAKREIRLLLDWHGPYFHGEVMSLSLRAWDFYFFFSALFGLYALHRLAMVREEGELHRGELARQIIDQVLHGHRPMPSTVGVEGLSEVPSDVLEPAKAQLNRSGP
jgi:MFS family permease